MAVPSSGQLREYADIGVELGVAQSNVSLRGMSQTAGFSTPDAMSEFYGYSAVSSPLSTVIYTGNGGTQSITGVGFQPDFVWIKGRVNGASGLTWHLLYDSVRGIDKALASNVANSELSIPSSLTSFNSDGFTLGSDNGVGNTGWNQSGVSYVAWCWKAGGAAVTNTSGSITSQVSANVEGGFSIVSYTGSGTNSTIGTGLNAETKVVIIKNRDSSRTWNVWFDLGNGTNRYLEINLTYAGATFSNGNIFGHYNNYFQIYDSDNSRNQFGQKYIAYCFAEKAGFSKFGTFQGNSTNVSITTGFEPSFVMWKNITYGSASYDYWFIVDNKRSPVNPIKKVLYPNDPLSESTTAYTIANFNSNGFQIVGDQTGGNRVFNYVGSTYIYMAFA